MAGYQQLGSPTNTASDFGTSVTEIADSLSWVRGQHIIKLGADLRWEHLNVIQSPSPTGLFTFSALFTDLPGVTNTGTPFASFLLGQVQQFSIDLQGDHIRNRAHFQEYFVQDDWRVTDRITINGGLRYTLNFPSYEANNQAAVFNLQTQQLEFLGRDGNSRAARRLHTNNFGPRLGLVMRATDKTLVRAGYGLVWIVPAFTLANGPSVSPIPLTADAGLGQGVFAVSRDLGSGYVQQWNLSVQRELTSNLALEVAYTGSKITQVGIPDSNLSANATTRRATSRTCS
ncbi:MAG: TonB-dependent receptor [Vicinamibacterales bacterium]